MAAKRRTRAQIVQSLLKPGQRPAQANAVRSAAVRRLHGMGPGAREQVRASVSRAYRRANLGPLARPLTIGIGVAVVVGLALVAAGIEVFLIAIVVPLACLLAFGVADAMVATAAQRNAREEIELAAAFDRVVDAATRELPESTLERLKQIKTRLVRLLPDLTRLRDTGALGGDDVFFVRQAVARYVPDALRPYLALSAQGRAPRTPAGDDPERMLNEQLDLLTQKLDALATRADEAQLETLRRNRTFLDRKVG